MTIAELPVGDAPRALEYPHFPTRFQAVIWRNWNLVAPERLALVLRTTVENIVAAGEAMGLVRDDSSLALWAERGFQTVIRRNWDLLPYEQLLELIDWSPDKLAFILKEDDFFWVKLGLSKPACDPVYYRELNAAEADRTEELRENVSRIAAGLPERSEAPFAFLGKYGQVRPIRGNEPRNFDLKMVYSYSALYGDPLLDPEIGSYPEAMLADYAACGVNAVWMQGTLYTLVPWLGEDQPCSRRWEERIANLNKLVQRGKKYGVDIIIYLNEPRAMPEEFFVDHPDWRGARESGIDAWALCISNPEVCAALENGVRRLFEMVPGLGGIFMITMSENLSHCKSRSDIEVPCPRCAGRTAAELTAQLNQTIARGARLGNPRARVIAYTWAWTPPWDLEVVAALPPETTVMTVSETLLETDCDGIKGEVLDYSISKVGPAPAALRLWEAARKRGLAAMAKVQFNCSWELAAVPYIPVPDLIERHLDNLTRAGVGNLMLSWTQGGYPGGNLELLQASREELAERKFGAAAPGVLTAWSRFSTAFEEFPFHHTATIYTGPANFGPMSLLWPEATGRKATMIGFPYDDLDGWRGRHFPEPVFEAAFKRLCDGWLEGLEELERQRTALVGEERRNLDELLDVAWACYCHFRSTWHQIVFVRRRDSGEDLTWLFDAESGLARRLLEIMRRDSRIGYEASNHYFYTENDLMEKILNCEYLKKHFGAGRRK